jgi:hypothetical protein
MATARLLAIGTLAASSALATLALAQAHGGRRPLPPPKPKPPTAVVDSGAETISAPAPSGSASAAPAVLPPGDAGVVPAPPADMSDGGGRLSPLNPAPNEFADAGPQASSIDYDKLLADVASLRARVAAVTDTLFHSRIAVAIETSGSHGRVASLSVSLDDGIVWTSPPAFRADSPTVVYEHAVAPGHHAVSVEAERRDDRNDTFRSTQRSRFVVDVPVDLRLAVEIKLSDDSNMANDFPSGKSGDYSLSVRMSAKAQPAGK